MLKLVLLALSLRSASATTSPTEPTECPGPMCLEVRCPVGSNSYCELGKCVAGDKCCPVISPGLCGSVCLGFGESCCGTNSAICKSDEKCYSGKCCPNTSPGLCGSVCLASGESCCGTGDVICKSREICNDQNPTSGECVAKNCANYLKYTCDITATQKSIASNKVCDGVSESSVTDCTGTKVTAGSAACYQVVGPLPVPGGSYSSTTSCSSVFTDECIGVDEHGWCDAGGGPSPSPSPSSSSSPSPSPSPSSPSPCAFNSKCGADKACAENCKTTCGSKSCTCTPNQDTCPYVIGSTEPIKTDCWKAGTAICTSGTGDGDDPCFARSSAHTCRLLDSTANPAAALADCFHGEARGVAEKVLMADLAAGDLVLGSADEVARVLLVQHKAVLVHSAMVRIEHASGSIELTPDHILPLDGVLAPASEAKVGSLLDGPSGPSAVTSVSRTADAIINPLTTSGKILAAGPKGGPVVASHAPERLATLLLSPAGLALTKYSAASGLSYLFPAAVQAFYDDRLEAFFSAHSAALGQAADALPAPVAITVAVAVDLGLAAAFAVDKLGGLALALVLAAALSLRSATGKPKRA